MDIRLSRLGDDPARPAATTVSIVDADGLPLPTSAQNTRVWVETRHPDETWTETRDVEVQYTAPPLVDAMLVADNSGSLDGRLIDIQDALDHFAHVLLARSHPDRVGLVRVSTVADLWHPLTTDEAAFSATVDDLFITNGWTALWDGVRLANESLHADATEGQPDGSVCFGGRLPAVLAFTDGQDNNSADEHDTRYAGDGIDTTLDQLMTLDVSGTPTVVHTIGVADDIDEGALMELAEGNGGRYTHLQNYGQLIGALHGAAAQLGALVPVCFTPAACDHTQARLTVEYLHRGTWVTHTVVTGLSPRCP